MSEHSKTKRKRALTMSEGGGAERMAKRIWEGIRKRKIYISCYQHEICYVCMKSNLFYQIGGSKLSSSTQYHPSALRTFTLTHTHTHRKYSLMTLKGLFKFTALASKLKINHLAEAQRRKMFRVCCWFRLVFWLAVILLLVF